MSNVYYVFIDTFGRLPADTTLRDLPTDSPCGIDCVAAIGAYNALLQNVDRHPKVVDPLLESLENHISILWHG